MATKKSQRIAISVIALVMLIGTVGGFIAMMVAPGNEAREKAALDSAQKEWNSKKEEQTNKLNDQYYAKFSENSSRVAPFETSEVTELKTEDIVVGEGDEVKDDTKFAAYYIGWTPDGKVFQQSLVEGKLDAPLPVDGLAASSLVEGWKKGLIGMRIGGVRELTIPSAQAYGETGSGESIPPNTPLKFIVMAIPSIEDIPMPQVLKDYYKRLYGVEI